MERQELAILYSGGRDSLALYALATSGGHPEFKMPRKIHLLHMVNGSGRFPEFPRERFRTAEKILAGQFPYPETPPEASFVELDVGRLFQGLWLDWYEELMPRYGGKNLVCVACKLAMHARAIIYCVEHLVPVFVAGYAKKQGCFPEQTTAFMERIVELSMGFGISTKIPALGVFDSEEVTRHFLEEFGLPSAGGGERYCIFSQTKTSATEKEIVAYFDDMIPRVEEYIGHRLEGRIKEAALCFPPGR